MLSLVDETPFMSEWGQVWQGDELDAIMTHIPKPNAIVSMVGTVLAISQVPNVSVFMKDDDDAVLADETLLALADATIGLLRHGHQVLIHCLEGHYRSTYMNVAVHMALGMRFGEAFALVKNRHPVAQLRAGTSAQLQRLETALEGELACFE